ncbi:FapA family protein [Pseudoclostridium thermosuccinogenes]|uniref:DUF342 domain-containing protein n=1 Tax=Clostridium thermosuccinogenes TaxID=84032 RepID=UPI000CCC7E8E|nr:FapA family protein [Pseudoclostridium thermosuccinogenes]PNT92972.1 hypothetical protein CDQ83_05350 [Pseudoclostridium thermosuccinogenes]
MPYPESKSEKKSINDGFFEIKFFENGIYLVVYPPLEKGRKVEVNDVIQKLEKKKIKDYDRNSIELAVAKADKIPVPIAPAQEEAIIDASATVTISSDKMKAYITLTPPEGGSKITLEALQKVLAENSVVHGINTDYLQKIAEFPVYEEMLCVAEGTPPEQGQDGKVEFFFETSDEFKPTVLDDGRVDFRELNKIKNVKKDQVLCVLIPPTNGVPGKTVTGVEIPTKPGKPATLPKGKNVRISPDEQSLLSDIDGQVSLIDGKVSVFYTYEVPADVDNSTGNITFLGNVIVRGNVLSGFSIDAGGSVEVWGVVEGAVIRAGGDIILRRGMQGLGKGMLISEGDIIARYIENSNIQAKNNIKAEAIMHSNVKCGNILELGGRKGLLVGGTCKVGKEIIAKVIGSYMSTATDVEVGMDPTLRERYKALREELEQMENDLRKTEQAISLLKRLASLGQLSKDKQDMLERSLRTREFYNNRISEIYEELPVLDAKLQHDSSGKVRVYNFLYPGVRIAIGSSSRSFKETLQYCTIYRDGADIRVGAIDK